VDTTGDHLGYIGHAAMARFVAARLGHEIEIGQHAEVVVMSFGGSTVMRHSAPSALAGVCAELLTCLDVEFMALDDVLRRCQGARIFDFSAISAEVAERLHGACKARGQSFHACAFQQRPQAGAAEEAIAVLVDERTASDAPAMTRLATLAAEIDCVGSAGSAKTVAAIEAAVESVLHAASLEALDLGAMGGVAPAELLKLLVGGSGSNAWLRRRQAGSAAPGFRFDRGAKAQQLARSHDHPLLFPALARQILHGRRSGSDGPESHLVAAADIGVRVAADMAVDP